MDPSYYKYKEGSLSMRVIEIPGDESMKCLYPVIDGTLLSQESCLCRLVDLSILKHTALTLPILRLLFIQSTRISNIFKKHLNPALLVQLYLNALAVSTVR